MNRWIDRQTNNGDFIGPSVGHGSNYQIEIVDFYNTPVDNVKKLLPNLFDKESMCLIMKLKTLLKIRIKAKKYTM